MHAYRLHLLAEELHEEHPHEDRPGSLRELGHLTGGGSFVLGLGEEVGHDGQEEGERRREEDADGRVEDGAHLGEAAVEVEVEEEGGEDEHDGRGGHYGGLVPLVSVGGGEVVHRQIECAVAPFVANRDDGVAAATVGGGVIHLGMTLHPGASS